MRIKLDTGDKITLIPSDQLLKLFEQRNFFRTNIEHRKEVADKIGGQDGIVDHIETKYAFDYFFFKMDNERTYSIPYESVDFDLMKQKSEQSINK